jgi:hypothetical protein
MDAFFFLSVFSLFCWLLLVFWQHWGLNSGSHISQQAIYYFGYVLSCLSLSCKYRNMKNCFHDFPHKVKDSKK